MISLPTLIERASRLNPKGTATRYMDRSQTWAELEKGISRLAGGFKKFALDEGDRVGILSLNSDRYYASIFAIPWAGLCIVPLNTRWALPENEYAINDSGTRVLLFDDSFTDQVEVLLNSCEGLIAAIYMGDGDCPSWADSYSDIISQSESIACSDRGGEDMAGIFYTGGTTGFPKGVMQSHQAIWASAVGALPSFEMSRNSVYLHAAPMFHMADFAGGMGVTICCAENVIQQSFDPAKVLSVITAFKVTHVLLVPAMIKMVLNQPDATSTDLSSLQCLMYGGSAMPAASLRQCIELWPHVALMQAYGQTELAPIATILSASDHRMGGDKLTSAGKPTAVSEIRIVDDSGKDCAIGDSGEVVVRGPHVMLGYWNRAEETAAALQNGWVFTGDAGYFDEDGYLFIVDRVKDMIVTGGENVFTMEVENALISHDAVQDVAVIGIPDEEWGEAIHSIVILQENKEVSEADLIEHCRARIAGYKLPKSITYRTEPMPLSGAGKVLKTELRKPFWQGRDRQIN